MDSRIFKKRIVSTSIRGICCALCVALFLAGCSAEQMQQFQESMKPHQAFTFNLDNKTYTFTTGTTTYDDLVTQIGNPNKPGIIITPVVNADGTKSITYRAIAESGYDPCPPNQYCSRNFFPTRTISDATFYFDKNALLAKCETVDKSNDPTAIHEWEERKAKLAAATATPTPATKKQPAQPQEIFTDRDKVDVDVLLYIAAANQICAWDLPPDKKTALSKWIEFFHTKFNHGGPGGYNPSGYSWRMWEADAEGNIRGKGEGNYCTDTDEHAKYTKRVNSLNGFPNAKKRTFP